MTLSFWSTCRGFWSISRASRSAPAWSQAWLSGGGRGSVCAGRGGSWSAHSAPSPPSVPLSAPRGRRHVGLYGPRNARSRWSGRHFSDAAARWRQIL